MVSDEALKKLQEQIAAWPITQRFVVQQLILDYLRNRENLRAYEDTGLTPEEFQSYAVFLQDLIGNQKASEALDRFRWLAEADKDGRLVVLPCKVGDTVWSSLDGAKYARECKVDFVNIGNVGTTFVLSAKNGLREQYGVTATAFGKTVFLTREAAEKALEAMKDE